MTQPYPEILLPRDNYRDSINLDSASTNFTLIRRSLVSKEETVNSSGSVRTHAFLTPGKEHLFFNLSSNLLGVYEKDHLAFKVTGELSRLRWKKADKILELGAIEFEFDPIACPIFLKVDKIHNREFPFKNKKDAKGRPDIYEGRSRVVHAPLHVNYWHFEFQVLDKEGKPVSSGESDWKKNEAIHFVESYLKKHLSVLDVTCQLPTSLYKEE